MKILVSGPMSGLPEFNYPAFNEAANCLRDLGHEVHNPAENPAPACGTWEGYMRLSLAQLLLCECIVLLPGWAESKGALIERKLAQTLGMEVLLFNAGDPFPMVPMACVIDGLRGEIAPEWRAS